MFLVSQAPLPGGALSTQRNALNSAPKFMHPIPPLFSTRRSRFFSNAQRGRHRPLAVTKSDAPSAAGSDSSPPAATAKSSNPNESISFVAQDTVPLEGVIQFEKPTSSNIIDKWGRVALLAGGDVLALLLFSAIGRFSHGFSVLDTETLRTADPFIAGWFLSAYFLGGYGEDGRGMNGRPKAVVAAAKSWSLGVPLGLIIRATAVGHIPPANFIFVTLGSTAILLVGWRAVLFSLFPSDKSKQNDDYRRGSPFELFELLTSLVRRW